MLSKIENYLRKDVYNDLKFVQWRHSSSMGFCNYMYMLRITVGGKRVRNRPTLSDS